MTNPLDAPTSAEEMIRKVAQNTCTMRSYARGWTWAISLYIFAVLGYGFAVTSGLIVEDRSLTHGMLVYVFPPMLIVRMVVEYVRESRSHRILREIFRPGCSDVRQNVSSSAISPLLDILSSTIDDNFFSVLIVLLKDLLKSLRAEDALILTKDQRNILHGLIMPGRQDPGAARSTTELQETERRALRPSVVSALALLGNSSSIPVLERFARKTDDSELRQAALQSITHIRERLLYGPEEMLRASRAPEHPETLLRAVSPDRPQATDSLELLRADNAPADLQSTSVRQQTGEQATPVSNRVKN